MSIQGSSVLSEEPQRLNLRWLLRFSMPVVLLIYCASFNWSYVKWISPTWAYLGLTYKSPDSSLVICGYVLVAVLSAFSPLRIKRPSQVSYWLIFVTVYVPGLFVPIFVQLDNGITLLLTQLSMTGGMLLIALSYKVSLLRIPRFPVNRNMWWVVLSILFITCNAILFVVFRHALHFASIKEIYMVRFQSKFIARTNPGITYVYSALANVINPFLIAYGLIRRRWTPIGIGIGGQLFIYSTAAMKAVLGSPLLIIIFYYSLKRDRGGWVPKLGIGLAGLFVVLTALVTDFKSGFLSIIASMTLMRLFALPGLFIAQYQHFFESFPHTYLGHIAGINLLFPSPYSLSTGMEVSSFYSGPGGQHGIGNANASFFAMDGIAGFGLPGIPVMGLFCGAVFWILDSCAREWPIEFSAPFLTMCSVALVSESLFSVLLGNGLMVLMLFFVFMPRQLLDDRFNKSAVADSYPPGHLRKGTA